MKIPVEQFHRDMAKILDQVVSGEEMILRHFMWVN